MNFSTLPDLIVGLSAGVAGVVLIVIGLPLCAAILTHTFIRALRRRRWERAGIGLLVMVTVGVTGAFLWMLAIDSAPGVYDEPLQMLAMTFLPFTVTFALLSIVVQRNASKKYRVSHRTRSLAHSSTH